VSFHLHFRYLCRYIKRGDHILEAGAGAGRFMIELAGLGAEITVGDVSPGQLTDLLVMCATYGWRYDDRKTRPWRPSTETRTV